MFLVQYCNSHPWKIKLWLLWWINWLIDWHPVLLTPSPVQTKSFNLWILWNLYYLWIILSEDWSPYKALQSPGRGVSAAVPLEVLHIPHRLFIIDSLGSHVFSCWPCYIMWVEPSCSFVRVILYKNILSHRMQFLVIDCKPYTVMDLEYLACIKFLLYTRLITASPYQSNKRGKGHLVRLVRLLTKALIGHTPWPGNNLGEWWIIAITLTPNINVCQASRTVL